MRYIIVILLATFLNSGGFIYAQDWQYRGRQNGDQEAQVWAPGTTPDGTAQTTLLIRNNCNYKNSFELQYIVYGTENIKNFNFEDFNGPSSPASKRKLMTVKIGLQSQSIIMKISVGGYFTKTDGGFGFIFNKLEYMKKGDAYRLANILLKNPSSISMSVSSYNNKNKIIQTKFPVIGAASTIAKATACKKTH